jgi:predicted DNA-binding transcriptional regulator YafY
MPQNLHALVRYRTIDRCLRRTAQRWTWRELAEACARTLEEELGGSPRTPSERQIKEDLRMMRQGVLGRPAPIVFDRRRKGYVYTDPSYRLDGLPLKPQDLHQLDEIRSMLEQFRGLQHPAELQDIIRRLQLALDTSLPPSPVRVQFDTIPTEATRWLARLHEAIREQRAIRLRYQPFTEPEPLRLLISPYLLKEYNRRWFLIGLDHQARRIHTHALDRILEIEPAPPGHRWEQARMQPERYFHHVIGVSIPEDGRLEHIRLRFSPSQAPYVRTKPLHHSQRELTKDAEGWSVFELRLIPNYELESLLLSFGERVEVMAPDSLRQKLARRLQEAAARYEPIVPRHRPPSPE